MLLSAHSADITQNLQKCMMMIDLKQNQIGRFCYTIEFTPSPCERLEYLWKFSSEEMSQPCLTKYNGHLCKNGEPLGEGSYDVLY